MSWYWQVTRRWCEVMDPESQIVARVRRGSRVQDALLSWFNDQWSLPGDPRPLCASTELSSAQAQAITDWLRANAPSALARSYRATGFEAAAGDDSGTYFRARLPDGHWGLFLWDAANQTMEHVDTAENPPHFQREP